MIRVYDNNDELEADTDTPSSTIARRRTTTATTPV